MTDTIEIHGQCDERFAVVKEAFLKNFQSGLEVGASFAATIDGEFVVDIWGGYSDAARINPWKRDTVVPVLSCTKVMTAICALILNDRGQLDLDAPVAMYWPEFAQAGKEKMPVRYLLSHQSGLAGFDESIPLEALYDWDRIVKMLAGQKPWWEPGKQSGYHAITFGYLIGEIVRRITTKTLGTFFSEEVAIPLNADFYIGLPKKYDARVAETIPPPIIKSGEPGYYEIDPNSIPGKALALTSVNNGDYVNDREWRGAEIPASNGHGNAHSMARIGAAMACGGELDDVRLMGLRTIEKAIEEQCNGIDLVIGAPIRYGLGFGLNSKEMPISPNPRTFYWSGFGGSRLVIDLDARLSWAYAMNKLYSEIPRDMEISKALYSAL